MNSHTMGGRPTPLGDFGPVGRPEMSASSPLGAASTSAPSRGPRSPAAAGRGAVPVPAINPDQAVPSPRGGGGFGRRGASTEPRGDVTWDHVEWLRRVEDAERAGDGKTARQLLREVSKHNYQLVQSRFSKEVPRTELVSRHEAKARVQGMGKDPIYTISGMTTGDALMHFATTQRRSVVCGLNFANGENVGGGYLNGARAQEEELCRQFPSLYTSLSRAKDYGKAYPFGPCTYRPGENPRDPQRYADVLFTPYVVARRGNKESGYRLLSDSEAVDNICLVSAAAPNIKAGTEAWDERLVLEAIRTILVAPKLKTRDPGKLDTLVLGAWGCGAFGCDAREMALLFAKALVEDRLGRLYKEVHFAIPVGSDRNAEVFEATLREHGVPLQSMGGGGSSVALARAVSSPAGSGGVPPASPNRAGGAFLASPNGAGGAPPASPNGAGGAFLANANRAGGGHPVSPSGGRAGTMRGGVAGMLPAAGVPSAGRR